MDRSGDRQDPAPRDRRNPRWKEIIVGFVRMHDDLHSCLWDDFLVWIAFPVKCVLWMIIGILCSIIYLSLWVAVKVFRNGRKI